MDMFKPKTLKVFKDADFIDLELLKIKEPICSLILFMIDNDESKYLLELWNLCTQYVPGTLLGVCNISIETKIASALTNLKGNLDNPLNWAGLQQIPFILIYRGGFPQGVYNGTRSVSAISNFILSSACSPTFHDTHQDGVGVEIGKNENKAIKGYDHNPKILPSTSEYKDSQIDYRNFNEQDGTIPSKI